MLLHFKLSSSYIQSLDTEDIVHWWHAILLFHNLEVVIHSEVNLVFMYVIL